VQRKKVQIWKKIPHLIRIQTERLGQERLHHGDGPKNTNEHGCSMMDSEQAII
jgi:hypothetical protein